MFSKHVSKQLSAYMHDEVSSESKRRIAEHLIACTRCRVDFEEFKLGAQLAQRLPLVAAPDSVWPRLIDQFERRRASHTYLRFWKPLAIAAAVVFLVGGLLLWLRASGNRNVREPYWTVSPLDGTPRIASKAINNAGQLRVGQWLETDDTSRAQIEIADIGEADIDPNTRVRLIETQPTEHRLELARGRLSARVWAPPKLFFVNTPSGIAEDLGCAYTLEVDDAGNSILHVTFGWVSLQLTDRESTVPAGAACATRRGTGPGTPYFEDASEAFRSALMKFDFGADEAAKALGLKTVISEARPQDAMTLWYLLSRVDGVSRARVYDRLAQVAPPPNGVTREGILGLNQQMLDRWKDELAFAPRADSPKLNLKKL
jgi:hypothetical protein